jgi:hypothetical protein
LGGVGDVAEQPGDRLEVHRPAAGEQQQAIQHVDDFVDHDAEGVHVQPGDGVEVPAGVREHLSQARRPLRGFERRLGEALRLIEQDVQDVAAAHGPVPGPKSAAANAIGRAAA